MPDEDERRRRRPLRRWRTRAPELVLALVVLAAVAYLIVRVVMPAQREPVHVRAFEPADPIDTMVVALVDHGPCTTAIEAEAVEYRDVIVVTASGGVDGGDCDSGMITTRVEIPLDLPLGSRLVIDGTCEISLDDRFPCPPSPVSADVTP